MFDLLWVPNFIKIRANFSLGTKFTRTKFTCNFGLRSSVPSTIFIISMFDLHWVPNFIKIGAHCNFETKSSQVFEFWSRYPVSNIIFMFNKLDLLWVSNFIALWVYFIFGTKFFWNEVIDSCFNVKYVLLGRNFNFIGGYLVITARSLVITAR